jgi:hypothetical protein
MRIHLFVTGDNIFFFVRKINALASFDDRNRLSPVSVDGSDSERRFE